MALYLKCKVLLSSCLMFVFSGRDRYACLPGSPCGSASPPMPPFATWWSTSPGATLPCPPFPCSRDFHGNASARPSWPAPCTPWASRPTPPSASRPPPQRRPPPRPAPPPHLPGGSPKRSRHLPLPPSLPLTNRQLLLQERCQLLLLLLRWRRRRKSSARAFLLHCHSMCGRRRWGMPASQEGVQHLPAHHTSGVSG